MVAVKVDGRGEVSAFRVEGGDWVVLGAAPADQVLRSLLSAALPAADSMYRPDQCREVVKAVRSFIGWSDDRCDILAAVESYISAVPALVVHEDGRLRLPQRRAM